VIEQGLKLYLQDNTQAWILDSEGNYTRLTPQDEETPISAQSKLLQLLAEPA
jgi:polyphosphate kinase